MQKSNFFAMISRMRHIRRWGLMRNSEPENLQEHALQTALIAHALAVIKNEYYGGKIDVGRTAVAALYHDASEILTGDLPTPVKYYNDQIRSAYKLVEREAGKQLLELLPQRMKPHYAAVLEEQQPEIAALIKAADKLSALIKCIQEKNAGNHEFDRAYQSQLDALNAMDLPEVQHFIQVFLPGFSLTLDEQSLEV